MFPGNKNKNLLIKKLVDVKTDIKDQEYDDQESYLGNTIEEDYNTSDDKSTSFVLTKIKNLTKSNTETQKKIVDTERDPIDLLTKSSDYKYPIDSVLQDDYESLKIQNDEQLFLCAYNVNTENLKPYLSYLLYNTPDSGKNLFYFPFITYDKNFDLSKQITEGFTALTKFNTVPKLSGYVKNDGSYYFFLEIYEIDIEDRRDENYVWSLIDELVNSKQIYNINLHDSVSKLFYKNPDLIFLYDMEENPYEIPMVVYTGDHFSASSFNSVFGKRKETSSINSLGNVYTFYNYETAKEIANKKGRDYDDSIENNSGVVRYAVFAGKTKVFKKEDLADLLSSETENNWMTNYHSGYIGKLTLQNGEKLADTPMLLTVKYDQQIPLTLF